jgi:hypothetical protein|mmetsp:Transcript_29145/g.94729  ORF Transcript_29145/g.94729 Transcript_29145/m.94729 type:complete len:242 (+) Transcript_29145:52-777(+)
MSRRSAVASGALLLLVLWLAVARLGLAAHDVLLVYAVGGFAWRQQERGSTSVLLGEDAHAPPPVRWADFLRDNHQLLGCVVRGNGRTRTERILAVAVSTLALLYWKAVFRTPKVSMGSWQGLRSSLWTLVVSKGMQLLMKRVIRFVAARQAAWQASAGLLESLQMSWTILQYWVIGFMVLCVLLFLREGFAWWGMLSGWIINLSFSLLLMDLVFCYIRFNLWTTLLPLQARLTGVARYRSA